MLENHKSSVNISTH